MSGLENNTSLPDPVKKALGEISDDLPGMESYRVAKSEILETSKINLGGLKSIVKKLTGNFIDSLGLSKENENKIMSFLGIDIETGIAGDTTGFAGLRDSMTNNVNGPHRYFDDFKSYPFEKNPETGVTLCSKTARLNLENLLGKNANIGIGGSSKEAYEKNGSPKNDVLSLAMKDNVNVLDIYLDATEKNKDFGHRVVGVRTTNGFMVQDVYNTVPGYEKDAPLDIYLEYMKNVKGRKIWGAVAYT